MSINYFTYNGINSTAFGIYITEKNSFAAPARDVSEIKIPGRSGNLVIDNNRFENMAVKYDCYLVPKAKVRISAFEDNGGTVRAISTGHNLGDNAATVNITITDSTNFNGTYTATIIDANRFYINCAWVSTPNETGYFNTGLDLATLSRNVKAWLLAGFGYYTLTDTYNTGYYRKASFANVLDIAETLKQVGKVPLIFNAKPFLYLTTGLNMITLTQAGTVTNPELFSSSPYIKITGSGDVTLAIGAATIAFTAMGPSIEIDSEIMNVFKGTTSYNSKMTSSGFPVLLPGSNAISWTGTVTKVEIIPRWCTL